MIREQGGITKDVFLRAVRDGLYGPDVATKDLPLRKKYGGRFVIRGWNYMIIGKDLYNGNGYENMRIWMQVRGGRERSQIAS